MSVTVPWDKLSPEALRGLIEEYVTREGTDYGGREVPLERKVEQVMAQLREGTALITFNPETGSVTIRPADD